MSQAQIDAKLADPAFREAFGDTNHPGHSLAFSQMQHLMMSGSSQAPAAPTAPAKEPVMTAEGALSAITALERDTEFTKAYRDGDHPDHDSAVSKMSALFQIAHATPEEFIKPPGPEPEHPDPDAPPEQPKSADELEADAKREQIDLACENLLGPDADARLTEARGWLGPEVTAAINDSGFGDDPHALAEIVNLAESDPAHVLRAIVQELVVAGKVHGSATLEIARKEGNREFMTAYLNEGHANHKVALAEMQALSLCENPPRWGLALMEKLNARSA